MSHIFADEIPVEMQQGVLYVSMECATAVHRCACGCGQEVVTPLSPTDWSLVFDGDTVSLHPSVGNWSLPCRSHYYIKSGAIKWAGNMSDADIEFGRSRDRRNKAAYFSGEKLAAVAAPSLPLTEPQAATAIDSNVSVEKKATGVWQLLKRLWK